MMMTHNVDNTGKHPYWMSAAPAVSDQQPLPETERHIPSFIQQTAKPPSSPPLDICFRATRLKLPSKRNSPFLPTRPASFIDQIRRGISQRSRFSPPLFLQTASQEVLKEWQLYDENIEAQVLSLPKISLSTKKMCTATKPWSLDINNNGLYACETDLTFCQEEPIHFNRLGKIIFLYKVSHYKESPIDSEQSYAYYDKKTKTLYSNDRDAIYHDHIQVSGGNRSPVLITLCDGCDKGIEVAKAAVTAAEKGHDWTSQHLDTCKSNHDVYYLLAIAVKEAQRALGNLKKTDGEETCKDTTYLQIAAIGSKLFYLTIGDGAIFVFRKEEDQSTWQIFYLTRGAKGTSNARIAGGFLKCSTQFPPEVTHVQIGEFTLREGDVIFACSDGVTDNLMPNQQHLKPADLGMMTDSNEWSDVESNNEEHVEKLIDYQLQKLSELTQGCEAHEIQDKILYYIMGLQAQKMPLFLTEIIAKEAEWRMIPAKGDDAACGGFIYEP